VHFRFWWFFHADLTISQHGLYEIYLDNSQPSSSAHFGNVLMIQANNVPCNGQAPANYANYVGQGASKPIRAS